MYSENIFYCLDSKDPEIHKLQNELIDQARSNEDVFGTLKDIEYLRIDVPLYPVKEVCYFALSFIGDDKTIGCGTGCTEDLVNYYLYNASLNIFESIGYHTELVISSANDNGTHNMILELT